MRLLHIADLHLGRKLFDVNLLNDQKEVLKQIINISVNNNVDAILISGDVYNNSSPTPEVLSLFNDFINELVFKNIKAYIIAGNHDSEERVAYFNEIAKKVGIFIADEFDGDIEIISDNDEYGKINFYLLPFVKPINVKKYYQDKEIKTYEDAVKILLENTKINKDERNVLLAHQFITGGEFSDVEVLSVGGLDNINAEVFNDFDYVALGHLHKAQKISRDTLRYSGSIMKYSFSEENHKKSVTLIDFKDKNDINIELIPLTFIHDVRSIKGSLEELMKMDYSEDYLKVILTDENVEPDVQTTLLTNFPNMLNFVIINSKTNTEESYVTADIENKSILELFKDFYSLQNNNCELDEARIKVLEEIIEELEEDK